MWQVALRTSEPGKNGVRAYYRHYQVNWKHSWHSPFPTDQQSIGASWEFAPAIAERPLFSYDVRLVVSAEA